MTWASIFVFAAVSQSSNFEFKNEYVCSFEVLCRHCCDVVQQVNASGILLITWEKDLLILLLQNQTGQKTIKNPVLSLRIKPGTKRKSILSQDLFWHKATSKGESKYVLVWSYASHGTCGLSSLPTRCVSDLLVYQLLQCPCRVWKVYKWGITQIIRNIFRRLEWFMGTSCPDVSDSKTRKILRYQLTTIY